MAVSGQPSAVRIKTLDKKRSLLAPKIILTHFPRLQQYHTVSSNIELQT